MKDRNRSMPVTDLHIDLTLVHSQSKATDLIRASLHTAISSILVMGRSWGDSTSLSEFGPRRRTFFFLSEPHFLNIDVSLIISTTCSVGSYSRHRLLLRTFLRPENGTQMALWTGFPAGTGSLIAKLAQSSDIEAKITLKCLAQSAHFERKLRPRFRLSDEVSLPQH
jgi:hypothetical protein